MEDAAQLAVRRQGDYGYDAPYVPTILGSIGIILLIGMILLWLIHQPILSIICLLYSLFMLVSTGSYLYTTRRGKFQVWAEILAQLRLRGDEQVLDIGCGRGAVLLGAARFLTTGKATGIDLWKTSDQSGNAIEVTRANAELEGVSKRVELCTGDMRELPFDDNTFDIVLSSLAIHNIPEAEGRAKALDEAARVLKPGGWLLIADMRQTQRYAEHLRELDMVEISHSTLDWRFWFGGPWGATRLVRARKPA